MLKQISLILLVLFPGLNKFCYSQQAEKVAVLWCDPLLNIREIYSRNGIINILNKVQKSGIEAIALGIKTSSGEVIYDSKIAPRLLEWDDFRVPLNFDPIQTFLTEGRNRHLQIYAVFSVFSEGHMVKRKGPIYNGHPEWQTRVYMVEEEKPSLLPITEWVYGTTAFANPLLSEVQQYEITLIKEFLSKYTVDALILDKVRFSGIESDFSESTRKLFETSLGSGEKVQWWPEDIYAWQFVDEDWQVVPGTYFQKWIEFRSKSIRTFVKRLVEEIHKTDPTLPVGNFVGAWYPTYYEYGVNWASESHPSEEEWASRKYYETAIADLLDYLIVGCYFPRISMAEAEKVGAEWWMSVEGSAINSMEVVNKVCPVYASILVELFKSNSNEFKNALSVVLSQTNGLYIYDLSYVEKNNFWDEITEVLESGARIQSKLNFK